jgi:hypothetical protein
VVLALALGVRLWQIDLTRFFNDQIELLQSASDWLDTGRLPLTSGFTFAVTGARHPPLVTYLLALPMVASRDPVWLSAWSAVLDALAAPVVYFIAQRITGSRLTGLAAGTLYALNAAAIVYGRMIWNPDFALLFSSLALLGLVDFAARRNSWSLALSLFALAWAAQLHVANLVLVPLWVLAFVVGRKKVRLWPLAIGGLAAVAPLMPYVYLQARSGWSDVGKLLGYGGTSKVTDLSVLDTAARLAGPATYAALIPPPGVFPRASSYDGLTWLLVALAASGFVLAWWRPAWPRAVVALWLALPILGAISHSSDPAAPSDGVAAHYLLAILPAMAVLQALAIRRLWTRVAPRAGAAATLAGLAAALLAMYAGFQHAAATNTRDVTYGVPLRYSLRAARLVRGSTEPLYLAVPFLYNRTVPALAGRSNYRWYPDRAVFVFPGGAADYLAENGSFGYTFLSERFGPPAATASDKFALFRLPAEAERQVFSGPSFVPLNVDFGGVRLEGYVAEPPAASQRSRLTLLWRILEPSRLPAHLSQFAHLVDASGRTISTAPDLYDAAEPWREGDAVASSFDLAPKPGTPTGGYWLETGFYDTFSQKPLSDSARVGPLRVQGTAQGSAPRRPVAVLGDDEIGLLGVRLTPDGLDVEWTALRAPQGAYTVFVHALDSSGRLVAQWDGLPKGGSFPTKLWESGDRVDDTYPLTAAGARIEIGMYTQPDVKRLPVRTPDGRTADVFSVDTASAR